MKPAIYRRNSWLPTNGWFPTVFDEFLNNDMLNTASNVAPSVNVKETADNYVVELAAPGVKKEYCRVHVDEEHNLCVAIENKFEHKEEDKHSHYLRREFAYTNFEQKYTDVKSPSHSEACFAKLEHSRASALFFTKNPTTSCVCGNFFVLLHSKYKNK